MDEKDIVDLAVEQMLKGNEDGEQPQEIIDVPADIPPVDVPAEPKAEDEHAKVDEQVIDIPQDKLLSKFNELSGLSLDSLDRIKDLAEKYNKYPELEKQLEVMPELLDIMEKIQNPLNYFKDEIAFKVNELSKDKKFEGKEVLIDKILRGNLSEAKDVDVIEIASKLKAKDGVRNPLRAELKSMGLDPDEVLENYDTLDDDTKDLLKIKADGFREELPKIGEGIQVPTITGTTLERVLNEKKAYKEDLQARKERLMPVSQSIVSQVKDLKITNDFSFKLELTPEQVKDYAEELTDIVASGQYDLNTDEGKKAVYGELIEMLRTDYFDKINAAHETALISRIEENARRKYDNAKPLDKKEPIPNKDESDKHPMQREAEFLISRGW
jgi:hypothetical protein